MRARATIPVLLITLGVVGLVGWSALRLLDLDPFFGDPSTPPGAGPGDREDLPGPPVASTLLPPEDRAAVSRPEAPPDLYRFVGRVVDARTRPLSDATVRLQTYRIGGGSGLPRPAEPIETSSDAAGRFVIAFPARDADHLLVIVTRGGFTATRVRDLPVPTPAHPEADLGDVVLGRGASVSGRVVEAHGGPARGIEVYTIRPGPLGGVELARQNPSARRTGPSAFTDDDGRFLIAGAPSGRALVIADPSHAPLAWSRELVLTEGRSVSGIELALPPGQRLHGAIVDERGRPVPEALVIAVPREERGIMGTSIVQQLTLARSWERGVARSDATGAYEIARLRGVGFDVAAVAPGFSPAIRSGIRPGDGPPVDLSLVANGRITGLVLERESGKPIPRFTVRARSTASSDGALAPGGDRRARFAPEDGRFELDSIEPGRVTLEIVARGYAPHRSEIEVTRHVLGVEITAFLHRGATLSGTAVDASSNAPVAGARVLLTREDPDPVAAPSAVGGEILDGSFATGDPVARTDEDGRFHFALLEPGAYRLTLSAPGHGTVEHEGITVIDQEKIELGPVLLPVGGHLIGEVLEEDGSPVNRCRLTLRRADGFFCAASTDSSGTYRFVDLPAGTYFVELAGGGLPYVQTVVRQDGDTSPAPFQLPGKRVEIVEGRTARLDFRKPRRAAIRGTVLGPDEEPVPGLAVTVHPLRPVITPTIHRPDARGGFSFLDLPPERHVLLVLTPEERVVLRRVLDLEAGEEQTLELQLAAGGITGRILSDVGQPVAEARITCRPIDGGETRNLTPHGPFSGRLISDEEGGFSAPYLDEGRYRIQVDGWGFARATVTADLRDGEWKDDLVVELSPGGAVEGQVVRTGGGLGDGVAFVRIRLVDGTEQEIRSLVTDALGRFSALGMKEGSYRVTGERAGFDILPTTVRVAASQTRRITLEATEQGS